ncbi:uncharacterized protein N0V89_007830 [Didymosphaeria variabile]|uniref:Uncharacterized protein n=1 Tax=Didymosphaeria variabile TaxID=1932322 RepID=A0A9W9CAU4_9PLEO|nr:uncharacterized protein N0V89_007830 [Didymosphaeria variabile]KAJ4352482.1 hypothetical protein N0V89_007830 [Didymosphaeria variabile]
MAEGSSTQKVWTLEAIRDWALNVFPDAFEALPNVATLDFENLDAERIKNSHFRLPTSVTSKLLVIGLYDGFVSGPKDKVLAFLHGEHCSEVGYIREWSNSTSKYYIKVSLEAMTRVDVEEPLCNIADGTQRATLTRLKTLVCYYFLASGQISQFGDYEPFTREFQKACVMIQHGQVKSAGSRSKPGHHFPYSQVPMDATVSAHDVSETDTVFAKTEDLGHFMSDDTTVTSPVDLSDAPILSGTSTIAKQAGKRQPPDRASVEYMLRNVNMAYTKLEKGSKRLKLDMNEARARDAELITELRAENSKLMARLKELSAQDAGSRETIGKSIMERNEMQDPTESHNEKDGYALAQLHNIHKWRLAKAQEDLRQAGRKAKKIFTSTEESYASYSQEIKQLQAELQKESARADAAEKKLAEVRACVGYRD